MSTTCICILNYNNGRKTIQCLSGVLAQTVKDYRVIIIDNHSTDDSLIVIQEFLVRNNFEFRLAGHSDKTPGIPLGPDEVLVIRSGRNGGYSYGNNLGISFAGSMNMFSYLLIINNDVVLKKDFLEETQKRFSSLSNDRDTKRIALGAVEYGTGGRRHHNGFQYIHLLTGITLSSSVFPSFRYIPGSCLFTDINAPLMDESFFLYFDDVQYSRILRKNGYILGNSPGSVYIHEVGGTAGPGLQWLIFKSLYKFYILNYPFLLPVVIPFRLILIMYLGIKTRVRKFISFKQR